MAINREVGKRVGFANSALQKHLRYNFLNLSLEDPTPDHSALSTFRKRLSEGKPGLLNSTFEFLKDRLLKKGVIVDASVVPAQKGSAGAEEGKRERAKSFT